MEELSPCSDPHPFGSLSDSSTQRTTNSDHEIILSSSRPKKRAGRKKFKETRHPVYRGIRRRSLSSNKWVCELREPNKQTRIWLGTYPTPQMAARAYDVAALALRGNSACLNFADSVWRLPVPVSKSPKDIRKAAAEAAEAFRPRDFDESETSATGSDSGEAEVGLSTGVEQESSTVKSFDEVNSGDREKNVVENAITLQLQDDVYRPLMNDEGLFNNPGLLADMAEGLLLSPPHCPDYDSLGWDDMESDAEVSLWSYSF